MYYSLRPHGLQHTKPPYPSPTPWVNSNSCPLSRWHHPTSSSSVIPFSSCPETFPASVQYNQSAETCPTLCDSMDWSTPGLPIHHQLPEFIYSSALSWRWHLTISSSVIPPPPAFNCSQHQGLFQWVSSSHQVAKVLQFQFQHQSFRWILRTDFLQDGLVWYPFSPRDSQESS